MLDDCMTNQHRKGHARAQIIADAAHCRGCRRFWAGGRQPLPWDYFRVACQNARNPSFVLSPTFTSTPGFWGPRRFHFVRLARSLLSAAGGGERMVTTLTINSSRVEASTSDNCYSTSEFK